MVKDAGITEAIVLWLFAGIYIFPDHSAFIQVQHPA
jgi:hypothetical protein